MSCPTPVYETKTTPFYNWWFLLTARAKTVQIPARRSRLPKPYYIIQNCLRNRNTIEFLGIWEQLDNPDFKPIEFDGLESRQVCSVSATLSVSLPLTSSPDMQVSVQLSSHLATRTKSSATGRETASFTACSITLPPVMSAVAGTETDQ